MKRIIYLLILLLLTVGGFSQTTIEEETVSFNNQFNIELEVLATNFSYTRRVSNNIRIGAGLGFGYSIGFGQREGYNEFTDGMLELIHLGLIIEFKLNEKLYYECKPQLASFIPGGDSEGASELIIGLKNGVFIQLKKIKLGFNIFVGKSSNYYDSHWAFYIKPLQLKIPIQ